MIRNAVLALFGGLTVEELTGSFAFGFVATIGLAAGIRLWHDHRGRKMIEENLLWRPARVENRGEISWIIIRELPDGTFEAHPRSGSGTDSSIPFCCVLRETAVKVADRLNAQTARETTPKGVDNQDQKL